MERRAREGPQAWAGAGNTKLEAGMLRASSGSGATCQSIRRTGLRGWQGKTMIKEKQLLTDFHISLKDRSLSVQGLLGGAMTTRCLPSCLEKSLQKASRKEKENIAVRERKGMWTVSFLIFCQAQFQNFAFHTSRVAYSF